VKIIDGKKQHLRLRGLRRQETVHIVRWKRHTVVEKEPQDPAADGLYLHLLLLGSTDGAHLAHLPSLHFGRDLAVFFE